MPNAEVWGAADDNIFVRYGLADSTVFAYIGCY